MVIFGKRLFARRFLLKRSAFYCHEGTKAGRSTKKSFVYLSAFVANISCDFKKIKPGSARYL